MLARKRKCGSPQALGVPLPLLGTKDSFRQDLGCLGVKMDSCFAVGDAFGDTPATKADHRLAASQRLDGDDAKVLDARKDQRAASSLEIQQLLIADPAKEGYVRRGGPEQVLPLRAGAGNHQAAGKPAKGVDGEVDALVRLE